MEPVENFRGTLAQYEILPYVLVPYIAMTFPWIEFVGGVCLILGYMPRLCALVLGTMSLGFFAVLTVSHFILKSGPASCGCFGAKGIHLSVPQMIVLDFVNAVIGFKLFQLKKHPSALDAWLKK